MSVCQYCDRPLDHDYEDIGTCPYCLDRQELEDCEDDVHYGGVWDAVEEDQY